MQRLPRFVLTLLMMCAFVTGCSSLKKQDPTLNLAINVAVMKVIEAEDQSKRLTRAKRIVDLADVALTMLDDKDVVVRTVYDRIMAEIRWETMEPSDRLLLSTLITQISAAVKERIDARTLDGDKVASAKQAVRWIKQAANIYADSLDGS